MNYVDAMLITVQKAGDLVLSHFRSDMKVAIKHDGSMVTEVDLACELLLKRELSAIIPGSGFMAEESGIEPGNEYTWVIDPIDGTKNFERGLPYFCISVALMHHANIIVAVTYAPALKDLFYAQAGSGAWLNGIKLSLQDKHWKQCGVVVAVGSGYVAQIDRLCKIKASCKEICGPVSFRVGGAAALDLAYVAAGMFDVAIFENLKWWDAAAGILLIQEAGGLIVDRNGAPINQLSKNLIAGNKMISKLILDSFSDKKEYV